VPREEQQQQQQQQQRDVIGLFVVGHLVKDALLSFRACFFPLFLMLSS